MVKQTAADLSVRQPEGRCQRHDLRAAGRVADLGHADARRERLETKFAIITNVQSRLTSHNNDGGTYTVMTPSFIYQNLILTGMTDASRG